MAMCHLVAVPGTAPRGSEAGDSQSLLLLNLNLSGLSFLALTLPEVRRQA